ncbi:autotransporter outer membrane beta-barrel domain-containing protein [Bordetella genomosp. 9]|nr:autotransporter outer membrane beta-barrel domain-containing protein [Bordetella genomosp. 9]
MPGFTWQAGAMRGAAPLGLLLNLLLSPFCDARAQEYAAEYGWSDRTIEVTDGDAARSTRVRGPVHTRQDMAHGVKALQHGSADLARTVIHTFGDDANGVYFSGAARLFITGASVTTRGERAHGLGSFDDRGDDVPDWAYANAGTVRMDSGTINLHGKGSHGVHAVGDTGIVHLGAALVPETGSARDSSQNNGATAPARQADTDAATDTGSDAKVWIYGKGEQNTAIHAVANRRVSFNGVRSILYGPFGTGILARDNATVTGQNLWLYGENADSVGLRAVGRVPCAIDAHSSRCPGADTTLHIARGFVHMRAPRSPAVEVDRARVYLRDVIVTTGADTPYAVGNEAGRFRYTGETTRVILSSHGSALRAWVREPGQSAVFYLTKADIRSGNDTLLELVRPGDAPAPQRRRVPRMHYAMLKLDDTRAHGAVRGLPDTRANIQLANGSVWRGHTDVGGQVYIGSRSTWAMNADSIVDALTMSSGGTLRFAAPASGNGHGPRFQTLTMRDRLRGQGRFEMNTHLARGAADRLDVMGRAAGSYAVLITDHSRDGDPPGPRAVPIVQARRGNASFVLENDRQAVDARGQRYTLVKRRTAAGTVWALEREADDAPANGVDAPGSTGAPVPSGQDRPTDRSADSGDAAGATTARHGPGYTDTGAGDADGKTSDRAGASVPGDGEANGDDGGDDGGNANGNGNDGDSDEGGGDAIGDGDSRQPGDDDATALGAPDASVVPPRAIQAALVNNGGIASSSALWMAALRPVEERGRVMVDAGGNGNGNGNGIDNGIDDGRDPRFAPTGNGFWIRGVDTRQHLRQSAGAYTQSLWGYTLGADRGVKVAAGRWRLGASIGELDAHRRFDGGKGRTSTVLFGLYAVLQLDNGAYASVAASAGRFRNAVQASAADIGGTVTGRYRHSGGGLAVAAGQRLDLARGWFVEPGAGLGYFKAGGARYTLSDGTAVHDRGGHTLQPRAGLRAGRAMALGNGSTATPYVRIGWLRDYGKRATIHADDANLRSDLSGNRFEIGAGAEARLGRSHFLYADVEAAKGGHLTRSRSIVAGYQYRW